MMGAGYARKMLLRQRWVMCVSVGCSIVLFAGMFIADSLYTAFLSSLIPIAFFMFSMVQICNAQLVNFMSFVLEGRFWVLWTGYLIQHKRMDPQVSKELIADPKRVIRIAEHVHLARSKRDLMLFKLSIGDYL